MIRYFRFLDRVANSWTFLAAVIVASAVALTALSITLLAPAAQATTHRPVVHSSAMVNCEDFDVQPCWTTDDDGLRVVLSYQPYTGHVVRMCPVKVTAAATPCLSRGLNRTPKGEPHTRNLRWTAHL